MGVKFKVFGKVISPLSPEVAADKRRETFVFVLNGLSHTMEFFPSFDGHTLKIDEMRWAGANSPSQDNLEFMKFSFSAAAGKLFLKVGLDGSPPTIDGNTNISLFDTEPVAFRLGFSTVGQIIPELVPSREDESVRELVFDITQSPVAADMASGLRKRILSWNVPDTGFGETPDQFGFENIIYTGANLTLAQLVIDFENKYVEVRTAPESAFGVKITDSLSATNRFSQTLAMKQVRLRRKNPDAPDQFLETFLEPANSTLFIHPEIFNFRANDPIYYQFALINGYLRHRINLLRDRNRTPKTALHWVPLPDAPPAFGLLLLKYLDGNSHPIALTPAEHDEFALQYRWGWTDPAAGKGERTIAGIVLAPPPKAPQYSLKARTLSYTSIDWDKRESYLFSHHYQGQDFSDAAATPACFWSKNRYVALGDAPEEILGVAKGTWFERRGAAAAEHPVVALRPEEITGQGVCIYQQVTLRLEPAQWVIRTQYEEKETQVFLDGSSPGAEVAKRVFPVATPVEIPAFDYASGASLMGPAEAGGAIPVIPARITDWVRGLNHAVHEQVTGAGSPDQKKHMSGFNREPDPSREKIAALFNYPFFAAENAIAAPPAAPLFDTSRVQFRHGPLDGAPAARALAPLNADGSIAGLFERLWNEIELRETWLFDVPAKENLAQLFHALRERIGAVRQDFGRDVTDARQALADLKRLVESNLTAVKGLGRRVARIQDVILALDEAQLAALWNAAADAERWQATEAQLKRKIPDEDRRILNALLDYYYRPYEKALLKELGKVIGSEERQAIADAMGVTRAQVEALFKGLETEAGEFVSQVLQGVDPVFSTLQELWLTLEDFRREYGPYLNIETYKRILREAGRDKLRALESALRQKLLAEFEALLTQLAGEDLAAYEEEIWNFLALVDAVVAYHRKYQPYAAALVQLKDCLSGDGPAGARITCLLGVYQSEAFAPHRADFDAFLADLLAKHYRIFRDTAQAFEDFVRAHEPQVEAVLILALQLQAILDKLRQSQAFIDCLHAAAGDAQKAVACLVTVYNTLLPEPERQALQLFLEELLLEQFALLRENAGQSVEDFLKVHPEAVHVFLRVLAQYDAWKALAGELRNVIFEARAVVAAIKQRDIRALVSYVGVQLGLRIHLADLRVDPPQYLAFGRNISSVISPAAFAYYQNWLNRVLNQQFKLCELGEGKTWSFNPGGGAVILLKLGNDLTAADILTEVEESNRKNGIGPFGSAAGNTKPLTDLIGLLHPEISTKAWRGVIILNPTADIANDPLLSGLCGLTQLRMVYAAVGGGRVKRNSGEVLDLYARIKQERAVIDHPDADAAELQFTLTRFDATIKNTALEAGEIEFQLDIRELLGRKVANQRVLIKGTLPQQDESSAVRDFEFAAWLPKPLEIKLDFAFLDQLKTSSIKAARRNNETVLEINAKLTLQAFGEVNTAGEEIIMKNFRILVPKAPASLRMGMARLLRFDLPAIETVIRKPRSLNFFGVELTPSGVGIIRGDAQAFASLTASGFWVGKEPADRLPANEYFVYLRLVVNFGNLPVLGGAGQDGLLLNGLLGFTYRPGTPALGGPYWLLYGVAGKGVVIDLFRFITLEAERLIVGRFNVNGTAATGLYLQQARLKVLDWPVLGDPDAFFNLLFLHSNYEQGQPRPPRNALLAQLNTPDGTGPGFFKIYWLLCAHNLSINPRPDPGRPDEPRRRRGTGWLAR